MTALCDVTKHIVRNVHPNVEQAEGESVDFFISGWFTSGQERLLVGKQYGNFKAPDFILTSILGEYF